MFPVFGRFVSLASGYIFVTPKKKGYDLEMGAIEAATAKKVPRELVTKFKEIMPHDTGGYNILVRYTTCSADLKISNSSNISGWQIAGQVKASTQADRYQIVFNVIKEALK